MKRHLLVNSAYVVMGSALITLGVLGIVNWLGVTYIESSEVSVDVVTSSVDTPAEDDISEQCEAYDPADDMPRYISIPSASIGGCIQRVGVDQYEAIAVPANIYLAGWYVNSARPGSDGVSVIDGHVLGRYNDAIFANLDNVSVGDFIEIEMGDGSLLDYTVIDTEVYDVDDAIEPLLEQIEGVDSQVNLITCTGTFDREAGTYNQRVIVRAALNN